MILRIPNPFKHSKPNQTSPIPPAYRPWFLLSLAVLVCSLIALALIAALAFIYYANVLTPLWLMLLGGVSVFGVALGFGGFFLLLVVGAYSSFKEDRISRLPPPQ